MVDDHIKTFALTSLPLLTEDALNAAADSNQQMKQ